MTGPLGIYMGLIHPARQQTQAHKYRHIIHHKQKKLIDTCSLPQNLSMSNKNLAPALSCPQEKHAFGERHHIQLASLISPACSPRRHLEVLNTPPSITLPLLFTEKKYACPAYPVISLNFNRASKRTRTCHDPASAPISVQVQRRR